MQTIDLETIVVFDIDGVVRDVAASYRRAISDTVEHFTDRAWRPTMVDIDLLKSEGIWNNDWEASRELIYRYFESQQKSRSQIDLDYDRIVTFFQSRYRGTNPVDWDGYISSEPILMSREYLEQLSDRRIGWGFFSGATRGSAEYVLKKRMGLTDFVLIAMEDAPSKPDPTGLFAAVDRIVADNHAHSNTSVIYVGDTVADMLTIRKAKTIQPARKWIAVGVLPPHIRSTPQEKNYTIKLQEAGATIVLSSVEKLNREQIMESLIF